MYPSTRKRKHRPSSSKHSSRYEDSYPTPSSTWNNDPDPSLYIQAYEADLVRGPSASSAARSLEVSEGWIGDGLIRWDAGGTYDARLLLDALPTIRPSATSQSSHLHASPPSPTPSQSGWSDLPSDTEDTFFLSPQETQSYLSNKRLKLMEDSRQARLAALRSPSPPTSHSSKSIGREEWDQDEQPSEEQKALMKRTAQHLMDSDNPAQLEMRILANHGADERFGFLRGRWGNAWKLVQAVVRLERSGGAVKVKEEAGGLGLGGYGSGDSDDGEEEQVQEQEQQAATDEDQCNANEKIPRGEPSVQDKTEKEKDDEALKAARRAKAREWAEKRRATKQSETGVDSGCR
ncbi:hypothetical protein JAAARDRAFT_702311 [Jaapia argillacea MUCL 33604]|uniref:SURP motif domain-containing protein n=1 Tax=Jaapia argillacea MUCL 33604 TaxID=933084 RepID=A0A067PC94_9AGAM|nr:hypothetical protein JAAARDRAFT_702311 [Jaapia argillacea MUCL 33604]